MFKLIQPDLRCHRRSLWAKQIVTYDVCVVWMCAHVCMHTAFAAAFLAAKRRSGLVAGSGRVQVPVVYDNRGPIAFGSPCDWAAGVASRVLSRELRLATVYFQNDSLEEDISVEVPLYAIENAGKVFVDFKALSHLGGRQTQEDRYLCEPEMDNNPSEYPALCRIGLPALSFFAVYDGHGGEDAAEVCSWLLPSQTGSSCVSLPLPNPLRYLTLHLSSLPSPCSLSVFRSVHLCPSSLSSCFYLNPSSQPRKSTSTADADAAAATATTTSCDTTVYSCMCTVCIATSLPARGSHARAHPAYIACILMACTTCATRRRHNNNHARTVFAGTTPQKLCARTGEPSQL